MWSGQWPGPEPAGLGRAWSSNMPIVLRAGPGLDILFAGRAGPGPHNSVCGPDLGRVYTTAAGPGRARAGPQIIFAGRAWASISGPCRALLETHLVVVCTTSQCKLRSPFRNLHCDVVHVTTKWVSRLVLDRTRKAPRLRREHVMT